jgi:glycosyltransferase involved in cell wall biosynthesis
MDMPSSLASPPTPAVQSAWRRAPLPPAPEPQLKIAVLAACPFPANHGTPGSIRELAEATAARGHQVHIVTYHFGDDRPLRGVRLHRIPDWTGETAITVGPTRYRPLYDMLLAWESIRVVRKYRLDLIHAHGYEAALAAGLCRLVTGRPVIYSAHNTMGDELASYDFFRFKWMARSLAWLLDRTVPRLGDRCIPHSPNLARFLVERGLQARCEEILPFGINLSDVPPDEGRVWRTYYQLGSDPIVLYAGVMDRFQRLDLLLHAMERVVRQIPRARLVFVVTVSSARQQEAIWQLARELGIERNILMTDPQDMDGALRHLWMADVAVVPRPKTPGFPIKLLNYMSTRRPCVIFASSANGVTHGKHVWQVEPDTPAALAKGILHLLANPAQQRELGRNAFDFVRRNHDRSLLAARVCTAYLRMLRGTRRWSEINGRRRVTVAAGNGHGSPTELFEDLKRVTP